MTPDTIVAIAAALMLAGSYALISWAPHARDLVLEIWDTVRTDPVNKERAR